MKVIARGYRTPHPADLTILSQMVVTPQDAEDHHGLNHDYYWEFEYVPNLWDRLVSRIPSRPTRASRFLGYVLVAATLLTVMAFVGAVE